MLFLKRIPLVYSQKEALNRSLKDPGESFVGLSLHEVGLVYDGLSSAVQLQLFSSDSNRSGTPNGRSVTVFIILNVPLSLSKDFL